MFVTFGSDPVKDEPEIHIQAKEVSDPKNVFCNSFQIDFKEIEESRKRAKQRREWVSILKGVCWLPPVFLTTVRYLAHI